MKRIVMIFFTLLVLVAVFVFGEGLVVSLKNKKIDIRSGVNNRIVIVINPKSVGKTSVTLSTASVVLDDTNILLGANDSAIWKFYLIGK